LIRRLLATLTVAVVALAIAVAIASCASKHAEPGTATPTSVPGSATSTSSTASGSPAAASAYIMFHDDTGALVARDLATGKSSRQTVDANTEVIAQTRCVPDGSRIAYLKQVFADATHRQIVIRGSNAPAQPITVSFLVQWIAWSPDGNKMALVEWDGKQKQATVAILDVNTGQMTTIMQGNQYVGDISWSSAGNRLTFYLEDNNNTSSEIYVMDATGANQVQLTHGNGDVTWLDPAWSPDGTSILAAGEQSNNVQLYRIDPSTGSTTQLTQSNDIYKRNPYYSPDGSIVAYTGSVVLPGVAVSAAALHQFAIFTMNPDGSNEKALTADPRGTTPGPNDPFLNAYMLGWCATGPWLDDLWTQSGETATPPGATP
jgi:Dipeptidyl peptidase IV (DPP IV) N-terminal region